MRIRLSSFAALLILTVAFCGTALAGTVYEIRNDGTTGPNVFPDLQTFQDDVVDAGILASGDVIEIYNDDDSLYAPIDLPPGYVVTIRSVGGQHTISGGFDISGGFGGGSNIVIENVHMLNNTGGNGVYFQPGGGGTLAVKNSIIENFYSGGMELGGGTTTTITNTVFKNNGNYNAFLISDNGLGVDVNVIMDSSAPMYTHWTSDNTGAAIGIYTPSIAYGAVEVGFDVAGGKRLVVDGSIQASQIAPTVHEAGPGIIIEKTGAGVLRLNGNIAYNQNSHYKDDKIPGDEDIFDYGNFNLNITEGTVHFGENLYWYGYDMNNPDPDLTVNDKVVESGRIHVGEKGVFKPSITAGNMEERLADGFKSWDAAVTAFRLEGFTSEKGASLQVGGVSSMPFVGRNQIGGTITDTTLYYRIASISDPVHSNTVKSLSINNRLMEAYLELCQWSSHDTVLDDPTQYDSLQLRVERIENLAILEGVGSYADVYRRMEGLSEYERDMLDDIYARGGAGSDIGFLQTIGGSIVQNSMLALRHNQAGLISRINTRLTGYHKEELELQPEITGSEVCYYSDNDPYVRYGEMWASIDQAWMTQNDVDTLAGYRYNSTGVTIGYDHHWDNMIVGGALNYTSGKMKLENNSGTRTDVDNVIAAVYASWASDGWYASGTGFAAYGWNSSESTFSMPPISFLKSKTGNYATSSMGLNFETGYMMETELVGLPIRVTPYGSVTYARLHRGSTRDVGATDGTTSFDRQFRTGNWNVWDTALGVRVSMPMDGDGYILIPSVDLAWTRTMGDATANAGDVHFIHDPSAAWRIPLMASNRSSYRGVAGLDARFANNLTIGGSYELEYRHKFWKNQFNIRASLEF